MSESDDCCPIAEATRANAVEQGACDGCFEASGAVADTAGIEVLGLALPPAYSQLLGLGLVMVLAHCGGMCGPLIMSFRFGVEQECRQGRMRQASCQVLAYQGGRACLYAVFGAIAGGIAAILGNDFVTDMSGGVSWVGLVIAAVFLFLALSRVIGPRAKAKLVESRPGQMPWWQRLGKWWQQRQAQRPMRYAFGLGVLLAFLPCMLTAWVLLLAASTGSVVHGALLMVLLVVMTTPALLPFALGPSLLPRLRGLWGARVQTAALFFSAAWMLLIALAANDVIGHAHLRIGSVTVMFF